MEKELARLRYEIESLKMQNALLLKRIEELENPKPHEQNPNHEDWSLRDVYE